MSWVDRTGGIIVRSDARVVIIGGGAMGVGLLYHLAHEGQGPDTVLIEKGELTSNRPGMPPVSCRISSVTST